MKVTVVGTGYVGLVTGACLADTGHQVMCIDNNEAKINMLQAGQVPIYEPGLEAIVSRCSEHSPDFHKGSGSLTFSTHLKAGVDFGEIIFIAVGTPSLASGEPNLSYVEAVARDIGRYLVTTYCQYRIIVNKSTVPIGSGDWVRMVILDGAAQAVKERVLVGSTVSTGSPTSRDTAESLDPSRFEVPLFDVVSNPEFLREGTAIGDTFNPDRIVVGSDSPTAVETMRQLYAPILTRSYHGDQGPAIPLVVTDLASAEMIKYAANAFLATKISFINEIANICERVGADVTQVAQGMGLDSRIGPKFLNAGLGWGGSCFMKDVSALIHTGEDYNYEARILKATVAVNSGQRSRVIEKLQHELKVLKGKTIGLLGLTFKPNTDDLRDAPSLTLIEQLTKLGAKVKAYDPIISSTGFKGEQPPISLVMAPQAVAQDADALVLVTEWDNFKDLDFTPLLPVMRRPLIVDGRNCLNRQALEQSGFTVVGVGR